MMGRLLPYILLALTLWLVCLSVLVYRLWTEPGTIYLP